VSITGTTVTHNQRWIELAGADNTRDLGGLATDDGGRTRFGRLLRAGTLQDLTPDDVTHLTEELGVRTVVDLRLADEAAREGSALSGIPAVRYFSLPLSSTGNVRSDIVADGAEMDIVGHYAALLEGSAANIVTAARLFADDTRTPAVFHCAAGKDRTGVVVAVALGAVGVRPEAIVADYAATGERTGALIERLRRSPTYASDIDSKPAAEHQPRPGTMAAFLQQLTARYGGTRRWLAEHGFGDADLGLLRAKLLRS